VLSCFVLCYFMCLKCSMWLELCIDLIFDLLWMKHPTNGNQSVQRGSCTDKDWCFWQDLHKNWVILCYYAASSGNSLPTFRDNLSVPFSRVITQKNAILICFTAEVWNHAGSAQWSVLPTVVRSVMGIYPRCESKHHSLEYKTVIQQTVPPTTSSRAVFPTRTAKSPAPRQTRLPQPPAGINSRSVVCIYTRPFFFSSGLFPPGFPTSTLRKSTPFRLSKFISTC